MAEVLRPLRDPRSSFRIRPILVDALSKALDERCGGNGVLNRLEAEAWLDRWVHSERARRVDPDIAFPFEDEEEEDHAERSQGAAVRHL